MNILDILYNLFFFLVALGVLVTFHEWGHFYAARKLGVKVLRFSVGFGKPLFKKVGKDGVEYVVAGIPLGGYVKMLDEREAEVPEHEKAFAYNRQPVWKRNIIVFAGPFANFLLAGVVYWIMFMSGTYVAKAITDTPLSGSIAEQAGVLANQEITAVDGEPVKGWKEVSWALVERLGEQGEIEFQLTDILTDRTREVSISIDNWTVDERRPDVLASLGIVPKRNWEAIIGGFSEQSAARDSGIQIGDRLTQLNDTQVSSFADVSRFMSEVKSDDPIDVRLLRDGVELSVIISPRLLENRWLLGIQPYQLFEFHQSGPLDSIGLALEETGEVIALTATMFKKLIVGEVSTKSLGGPIAIAEGAGSSARGGWVYFLSFLGMISVNLGLINLLPVPVLDGGHLLFNTLEWIKGKPLSESAQEYGMRIGIVLVLGLMAIAFINDIARL